MYIAVSAAATMHWYTTMYCSIDSLCQTCCYICIEQVIIAIHHSHHAMKQDQQLML